MTHPEDKRRADYGYEASTPQCCNCVKYRKARFVPPKLDPPFCTGGRFTVQANGCCDKWKSKTGERLA